MDKANEFKKWMEMNLKLKEYTRGRYSKAINTISDDLNNYSKSEINLYSIEDPEIIMELLNKYLNTEELKKKDKNGNRMYSNSLKRYIEYLTDKRDKGIKLETEDNESDIKDTEHEIALRKVNCNNIANFTPNDEDEIPANTSVDLANGIAKRKKRTERHQDIVKLMASLLELEGYTLYENPVDCLAIKGEEKAMLFEVKTLDGTSSDEKKQVQKCFAQLFYYEQFFAKEKVKNNVQKIAVFENKINDKHITFFKSFDVDVFWIDTNNNFINKNGIIKF